MKIAILGTGVVGRAHAGKLLALGHEVYLGTQDVAATLADNKPDMLGVSFIQWHEQHPKVHVVPFAEAAAVGEIVLEALKGTIAVETLILLAPHLAGKTVIDIANPLDFSQGMPPSLFTSSTDSLGERIQMALPDVHVVKMFSTVNAVLQVDPKQLPGNHVLLMCGNNATAKEQAVTIARDWYGWQEIIDLGDITGSRSMEMLLPMWLRLWNALQTPIFNFAIIKK